MEGIGIKGCVFFKGLLPRFPIDVFGLVELRIEVEGIGIPFAANTVARVVTLRPNERADLAAADELGAFLPAARGAALRTDLEGLASALDGVIHRESFAEITAHRFFAIDV